jgi:hypothetical protein
MIELIDALPSGTLGFRCSGRITGEEMQRLVIPPIEAALLEFDHIKALVVLEPSFEGLSLEAAWDDTALGLRHWDGFDRLALVTDLAWARHGMRAMALLLPRRWLSESLGTVHIDRQGEVITISLIGQLDEHTYARIDDDLAQVFSEVEQPRVLLDLREFDGWLGLKALRQHLALIRDYRHRPTRLAMVSSQLWQPLAQRLIQPFSRAQTHTFTGSDLLAAQEWICAD